LATVLPWAPAPRRSSFFMGKFLLSLF